MSVVSEALEIDLAAEAFLTPTRQPVDPDTESQLGDLFWVNGPMGRIAVRRRGKGPQVLLVHGWGGSGGDLTAFVEPLVDSGFRVLTVDLPAHGQSQGKTSSIQIAAEALLEVECAVGHFFAVIAHSAGTAAVVHAMTQGLHPDRLVLISAPARYLDQARRFAHRTGLDKAGLEAMLWTLKHHGINVRAVSTPKVASVRTEPVLFIHSADDKIVPIQDGLESAAAWKASKFLRVDKLGHRRILSSPQVISAAIQFVEGDRNPRHEPLLLALTH